MADVAPNVRKHEDLGMPSSEGAFAVTLNADGTSTVYCGCIMRDFRGVYSFDCSKEMGDRITTYLSGEVPGLIPQAFPDLSADLREMIMTGITPENWLKIFPPGEEEDKD